MIFPIDSISFPSVSAIRASAAANAQTAKPEKNSAAEANNGANDELTAEEKRQVAALKARDREVRTHEAAHQAAGGGLVRGGASFKYETGPDNKRYAVGGEVSIDTSPVAGDPEATIQKAETIRTAALAPAEPSSQDRAVAAQASRMSMEARAELAQQKQDEETGGSSAAINAYNQTPQSDAEQSGQLLNIFA